MKFHGHGMAYVKKPWLFYLRELLCCQTMPNMLYLFSSLWWNLNPVLENERQGHRPTTGAVANSWRIAWLGAPWNFTKLAGYFCRASTCFNWATLCQMVCNLKETTYTCNINTNENVWYQAYSSLGNQLISPLYKFKTKLIIQASYSSPVSSCHVSSCFFSCSPEDPHQPKDSCEPTHRKVLSRAGIEGLPGCHWQQLATQWVLI